MKGKGFLVFLIVALVVIPPIGFALDPNKSLSQYVYDAWGIEDGLPQISVLDIAQTHNDYLWIATGNGLVRFDGVRFEVFNDLNTKGLTDRSIVSLKADKDGNLWIGTREGGLCRFSKGKFTAYTTEDGLSNNYVNALATDAAGNLWIGTLGGGLCRFNKRKFTTYTVKDGLSNNVVTSLAADVGGNLWIGTWGGGLCRFNRGTFTTYTGKDDLPSNYISALFEDRRGNLWIGTREGGLCRFNEGKFTTYTIKNGLSGNTIYSIYEDRQGNLWVGAKLGLNRFKNGAFISFTKPEGLANHQITRLYEDREGSLWIGSYNGGLARLQDGKFTAYSSVEGLSGDSATSVYQDRKGNTWIGTDGQGLNRFKDGEIEIFSIDNGLSSTSVTSILEDQWGYLWVGMQTGINRMENGIVAAFYTRKDGLSDNRVLSIYEDKEGNIWIGTRSGLNRFKDGTFTAYNVKHGLSGNDVSVMLQDREGVLWIGTNSGLTGFENNKFTAYTREDGLSYDNVISLLEDREGSLWIGTQGGGLNRMKNETFTVYTTQNGLVDDTIYEILEDDNGKLWMGSNKGIFHINITDFDEFDKGRIDTLRSISYGQADGMKATECSGGTQPSGWKDSDGKLWFTTVKGVVVIDPAALNLNKHTPPVIIEKILVDNKPIPNGQNFRLEPGKENFEFQYTAPSFQVPQRVKFKYRLDGFDDGWKDAGTRRTAYYNSIPPGDYRFQVIACNNDGVWNNTGASVSFYLKPYFHQTPWFYFLCALLLGLIVSVGYRYRVRQLKEREKELSQMVEDRTRKLAQQAEKLKEMDNIKSRFFANISHEFRTPLTLIMGPIEQMIDACPDNAKERKRKLTLIFRNAQRLLRLINQLLELSKLDSGKMKLQTAKIDIVPFVKGMVASFQLLVHHMEQDLLLHLEHPQNNETETGDMVLYIDPQKMEIVLTNLLANAIKFTPRGGKVEVTLKKNL
ncbi:MAG: hypothetical protein GY940_23235, partial [bacterium]|nr:hypothetical protein [bacterium]